MNKTKHKYSNIDLHNDLEKIKNAISEAAYDIRDETTDLISHSVDTVKERSQEAKDNLAEYTADKPFKTIGIALGVGLLVGLLLRGKK